jgi:hypothetical protein
MSIQQIQSEFVSIAQPKVALVNCEGSDWGEMEGVGQTISYQLGMHPLKIAHLSSITVIMMKRRYLNNH